MAVLACTFGINAQLRTYSGTVLDATTNEPLIGVTVAPQGGGQATATDVEGKFTLRVPQNVTKAKFTYVGYNPATVDLRPDMKVYLQNTSENLDELVVVAYGQQKKSSITGSVSQVNADKISERPVSSVASALEGTTSGITISGNYGEAGSSPTITIRGLGSINGTNTPLYVIDGVPFGGNVTDLNPDDIESMSVLKDAASAALYGNRASNGVILITTKTAKEKGKIRVNFKTTQGWYERGIPEYERAGISDWMQAQYYNYRNAAYMTKNKLAYTPENLAKGNDFANINFVDKWIYSNIFDMGPDGDYELFSEDGVFNRNLAIKGTYAEDLDWWDQAIRNGYRGEYTLNVMGATTKSDYRFSLGYLSEDGYMRDNTYNRITAAANINVNPVNWLKTGLKLNVSHQNIRGTMNGVGDGNTSYNNAFYVCRYISPIYPVHIHNQETGEYLLDGAGGLQYDPGYYTYVNDAGKLTQVNTRNQFSNRNVIWESEVNKRKNIRNTINGTAYVDFILPFGFVATIRGNLNTRNQDAYSYGSALVGDAVGEGSLSKTIYTYKNWTFQQQLNWNRTFNEKHSFNVLLAHENYSYQYDYTYDSKRNQAFEGLAALSNFAEMKSMSGYRSMQRTESYLARVQYNFDDRYNIEGSFRRDGTSRFYKKVRWGNFGSVGANWVFSNEDFVRSKTADWLNLGKLYVNWGQVGNDASAGYYSYMMLESFATQDKDNAFWLTQLAAPTLKWETSESFGVGFETRFFNRWNLSAEYYLKNNKDLIFSQGFASSGGATGTDVNRPYLDTNIGSIRNQGFEISTDVDVFVNKDWKINIGANLNFNDNKITKLPDEYKYFIGYDQNGNELNENGYLSSPYKLAEGHGRYDYYTYHWAGVDQMTGKSLYTANLQDYYIQKSDGTIVGGTYSKDEGGNLVLDKSKSSKLSASNYVEINGEYYVNNYTYAAKSWAGSALPKVNGAFNANISFRDFSLTALFTYSLGGKLMDYTYQSLMSPGNGPTALSADILNSWMGIPEGMTADSPNRISTDIAPLIDYNDSYSNTTSDRWLISRNYLCFKNINFSYSLPKKIIRPAGLSSVKASFSAENLFLATHRKGLNPQQGSGGAQSNYLVPARVFTFGLALEL
ncbi:MAG: SusC/RagA family TonB-linked outer membrane protein [Muribaculaceae bacterium]|nr:SusC/RagA family TonB-linked outer membrane protein [Muribaculaceae bacterium]